MQREQYPAAQRRKLPIRFHVARSETLVDAPRPLLHHLGRHIAHLRPFRGDGRAGPCAEAPGLPQHHRRHHPGAGPHGRLHHIRDERLVHARQQRSAAGEPGPFIRLRRLRHERLDVVVQVVDGDLAGGQGAPQADLIRHVTGQRQADVGGGPHRRVVRLHVEPFEHLDQVVPLDRVFTDPLFGLLRGRHAAAGAERHARQKQPRSEDGAAADPLPQVEL